MSKTKIGELLVKFGHIEKWQLDKALETQEKEGGLLGEILVKSGFLKDKTLIDAPTQQADTVQD